MSVTAFVLCAKLNSFLPLSWIVSVCGEAGKKKKLHSMTEIKGYCERPEMLSCTCTRLTMMTVSMSDVHCIKPGPTPWTGIMCMSQHTDASKNIKAWAVSQHTDDSKNTKTSAVSQHIDTGKYTKASAVSQHTDDSKNTKAWAVSQHTDTINNTKVWAVSQNIDNSKYTKAWAMPQHTDISKNTKARAV